MDKVVVAGVGMVPFAKPGKSENYHQMGEQAAQLALRDARVDYAGIQQAMNTALGVLRVFGCPIAPFGSGGGWLVTGRRGTEAGR